jgi:hypothetical protein
MEWTAAMQLQAAGVGHHRTVFRGAAINPLIELMYLLQLLRFIIWFRFATLHCASPNEVLDTGLVSRIFRVQNRVQAISWMRYGVGTKRSGVCTCFQIVLIN